MKVSEVDKKDSLALANFLNSLKLAKFPDAPFGHLVSIIDGTRWLESLFKSMADDLSGQTEKPKPAESFKIKDYNPGQP